MNPTCIVSPPYSHAPGQVPVTLSEVECESARCAQVEKPGGVHFSVAFRDIRRFLVVMTKAYPLVI